jgi:hypothetical protein
MFSPTKAPQTDMTTPNEFHYHCLIDPSDNSIISQGETAMKGRSPLECGNRVIEQWGRKQLPSMQDHEARTLDYFYATSLIRPHRSVATFTKGPFVAVRSVTGSTDPGYEEHYDCQPGHEGCKPASFEEFPLPEDAPDYLAKENFYDQDAIKHALADCIEELRTAVSSDFTSEAIIRLLSRTEILVASTGGRGLHPHPVPFFGPNEEDGAIQILDLVIFAILNEGSPDTLPQDVIIAHNERRRHSDIKEYQLRRLLAEMKSDAK